MSVWFRYVFEHGALDRHFSFFCAPLVTNHRKWIFESQWLRGYPDEVVYFLLLSDRYDDAVKFVRLLDKPVKIGNAQGIDVFASYYSMDVLTQIHRFQWRWLAGASPQMRTFMRLMLEHRNFRYEEGIFQRRDTSALSTDAPVGDYIPNFFRDPDVIDRLMKELDLDREADASPAAGIKGSDGEPVADDTQDNSDSLDVYMFYAYRHLLLRTYHNGEGDLVPLVYTRCMETQRSLRRNLPPPSRELKRYLDRIGTDLSNVRLLSPDWSALIGHNGHLNVHLMMRQMGWWDEQPVLLAYNERIANKTFLSLFSDICPTLTLGEDDVSSAIWHELASLTPFLGDSHQAFQFKDGRCVYWNDAGSLALQQWEQADRGVPLRDIYDARLRADDRTETVYQALRKKWGLAPDDWFVCLHMRDAEARGETLGTGESIRSAAIGNYLDTVRFITDQGGWVIRMGGRKAPPLPPMPRVIDYARSQDQMPEMDIHLMRRARIFIGTTSGFAYVATSFGIPTAMVNALSSVGLLWSKDTRFSLKPVHTREGRLLSLSDVTSERWRWTFPTYETVKSAGLTVSESSSDEILETTREVLDLTSGAPPAIMPVTDDWEKRVNIPGFFGSSRPARYFVEKYPALMDRP
ncbi:TIGR04372 family glycosyltransferase [Bradyrhizobium sp. HKCCYLRH3061]|uniref:TIGR04372 family glycosyltransferase n=1 Tax=Bradyrhizobium sp. HKCCYLRH3061 TaxID=3420734 RepID=UPI003EBCF388